MLPRFQGGWILAVCHSLPYSGTPHAGLHAEPGWVAPIPPIHNEDKDVLSQFNELTELTVT